MDKGVRRGYVDHHFKGVDEAVKNAKAALEGQAKRRFYDNKDAFYRGEKAKDLEEFKMVQESRPMLPPSRRK